MKSRSKEKKPGKPGRTPLAVRMNLFHLKTEQKKRLPPPVVACEPGDSVIVAHEGAYWNGVVEEHPYWADDNRYVRVRTDEGIVRVKAHQIVKVEV